LILTLNGSPPSVKLLPWLSLAWMVKWVGRVSFTPSSKPGPEAVHLEASIPGSIIISIGELEI